MYRFTFEKCILVCKPALYKRDKRVNMRFMYQIDSNLNAISNASDAQRTNYKSCSKLASLDDALLINYHPKRLHVLFLLIIVQLLRPASM